MDNETFQEIINLEQYGYEIHLDQKQGQIQITTKVSKDENRTNMNIYTGFKLAEKEVFPITHRGYVYWVIDLEESDPDFIIKTEDLKKILDTALMNASHCPVPQNEDRHKAEYPLTPDEAYEPIYKPTITEETKDIAHIHYPGTGNMCTYPNCSCF